MLLSQEQVEAYFERIGLPQTVRESLREGGHGKNALEALTTLQGFHMAAIPFDNLQLHYSSHRSLPQETELVYENVVTKRRGGTCPQVHQLFVALLRSLGFQAYCTGGRLNAPASPAADPNLNKSIVAYGPWVHVNTIVIIDTRKYVVDTNFGQFGSPFPVRLVHDEPMIDVWHRSRRMIHARIPGWTDPEQKWWRMQLQENGSDLWMDVCCFMETEWRPVDFHIMISGLASLGAGWFKSRVICFHIILEKNLPVGYRMIWQDELRQVYKGESAILRKFYTEDDRLTALEEEFDICFNDEEQKAIRGTSTELKDDSFDFYEE